MEKYALTQQEAGLVLGVDFESEEVNPENINAILEVCTSGPGLANSYVLRGGYRGVHEHKDYVVIPVQYYQIDSEKHESLSLRYENNKVYLDRLLFFSK